MRAQDEKGREIRYVPTAKAIAVVVLQKILLPDYPVAIRRIAREALQEIQDLDAEDNS